MTQPPLVIDIYKGDDVADPTAVRASGIVGVVHKATEGKNYRDSAYPRRRKMFGDAGLLWGAYCFYHGGGAAEADAFLSYAEPDADTLVALDWESVPSLGGYSPTAEEARAFLERVEDKLGRRAVVYSGNVAKEQLQGHDAYFGSHRLWLAQYGTRWATQASWDRPWLWQNNGDSFGPGPHQIPGMRGNCDNNTIVDPTTVADLVGGWSGAGATAPPAPVPVPSPASHDARWLQGELNRLGFANPLLSVDGDVREKTVKAMIRAVEKMESSA